jgi:hypothetical protein
MTIDGPPDWDFNFSWVANTNAYTIPTLASTSLTRSLNVTCRVFVNGVVYATYTRLEISNTTGALPAGPFWISGDTVAGRMLTANSSNLSDADGIVSGSMHYVWTKDGVNVNRDNMTYTPPSTAIGSVIDCTVQWNTTAGETKYVQSANQVTLTAP